MSSIGVALPLRLDFSDGFVMIKDIKRMFRQNLKMLILTNPGERVMDPLFGVGMKSFLFENFQQGTYATIDAKIREQVSKYMPMVKIVEIQFAQPEIDNNTLSLALVYTIPKIGVKDLLEFTI